MPAEAPQAPCRTGREPWVEQSRAGALLAELALGGPRTPSPSSTPRSTALELAGGVAAV